MQQKFNIYFFLLLFISLNCIAETDIVVLNDITDKLILGKYLEYLEDPTGKLTIEDVISNNVNKKFKKNRKNLINFGHTSSTFWVKFEVRNDAFDRTKWILKQNYPNIHYLDFYSLDLIDQEISFVKTGQFLSADTRDIKYHGLAFNLEIPLEARKIYYLRYKSHTSMIASPIFYSTVEFNKSVFLEIFLLALFLGILIIIIVYNIFLFIFLRTFDYFYFAFFILFYIFYQLSYSGIGGYYLWNNILWLRTYSILIAIILFTISIINFADKFLEVKKHFPVNHIILSFLNFLFIIQLGLIPFFSYAIIIKIVLLLFLFSLIFLTITGIMIWLRGIYQAFHYLLSWLIIITGIIMVILVRFSFIPSNFFTENFYILGFIWLIILWAFILAGRIKLLKVSNLESLLESERLSKILEATSDFVSISTIDNKIIYMNQAGKELIGLDNQKKFDKKVIADFHPEHEYKVVENIGIPAAQQNGIWKGETALLTSDGKEIPVSQVIMSHKSPDGKLQYFSTIIRDISLQKEIETKLRAERDKFENLLDGLSQIGIDVNIVSSDYRILSQSSSLEERFGNVIGKFCYQEYVGFNEVCYFCPMNKVIENNKVERIEVTGIRDKEFEIIMAPLTNQEGIVDRVIEVVIDITHKKKTEAKLLELQALLNAATEQSPSGILIADAPDVNIRIANAAALGIRGETDKPLTDIPVEFHPQNWQIYHLDMTPFKPEDLPLSQAILKGIKSENVDALIKRSNGEIRWIIANAAPVYDKTGNIIAGVVVFSDITDKKRVEDQLQQAQKMETVGNLAGGIAHDFNNVLGGIIGALSILKHKLKSAKGSIKIEKFKEYIEIMSNSSDRASDMVKHLLAISRKQELSLTSIDLNLIIKHVIKICESTLDKSVKIKPKYLSRPAIVNADITQIEQVLLNLCLNAGHAMTIMKKDKDKWGGTLSISLEKIAVDKYFCQLYPDAQEKEYWLVSVKDNGVGIDKVIQNKIFDPFFTTKENISGTGLGLSMVYNIIKQHNGVVNLYSEPGSGTTFNVYLPMPDKQIDLKQGNDKITIHKGKGVILVAEDEEIIRYIVKDILEECGYQVILTRNGKECVDIYQKQMKEIDAVLLDMAMPEMSGKDAYIQLRLINPRIKVLFTSGFWQDQRIADVKKMGVEDFIHKPYTLEKLSTAIYNLLKKGIQDSIDREQ